MDVSHRIPAGNATPAHELFHLYQNGYTFFKNRWFTEGTARWAESAFSSRPIRTELPQSTAQKQALFRQAYEAASFWDAIAEASRDGLRASSAKRYVRNGQLVLRNADISGSKFVVALFEELDRTDDWVRKERGHPVGPWPERLQKSADNNRFIWKAILRTISTCCRELGRIGSDLSKL